MANEESNTSAKVIKERTVKKRAARSIVAPKADEEITGREARRKEAFVAMNRSKPVTERESRVIKTPGGLKMQEEGAKSSKMVTAPIQLTWNEDTLTPVSKTAKKIQATGWPERPPEPIDKWKNKPSSSEQAGNSKVQGQGGKTGTQQLPRIPETQEALKDMTAPLPDIEEELQKSNPARQRYTPEAVREKQNGAPSVKPMKSGPKQGMQGQLRTVAGRQAPEPARQPEQNIPTQAAGRQNAGSYGQPHSNVSGLTSVKDANVGNTTVWNPIENEQALSGTNKTGTNKTAGVSVPASMRDPKASGYEVTTAATDRTDSDIIIEANEQRGHRRILKTVVTTTTTTTYETVNDDDLREISTPPETVTTEMTEQDAAPVSSQAEPQRGPVRPQREPGGQQGQRRMPGQQRRPGQQQRPPGRPTGPAGQQRGSIAGSPERPGQRPQAGQNTGQPASMGQGSYRQPVPGQSVYPGQNVYTGPDSYPGQNVYQGQQPLIQGQQDLNNNVQMQNGIQQPPQGHGSVIDRMMAQPPSDNKPMTAMDKQLADIEKALGISSDTAAAGAAQEQGVMNGSAGVMQGTPGGQAGMGAQANMGMTGTGTAQEAAGTANPPGQTLDEDVFKGIDTFSKSPDMNITASDKEKRRSSEYTMLAIEAVIFVVILCVCVSIYSKIRKNDFSSDTETAVTEEGSAEAYEDDMTLDTGADGLEVQEAGLDDEILSEEGTDSGSTDDITLTTPSDSVDVENDSFSLRCTNVTVVLDSEGNPAALIYFTFVNKTSKLLAMSEVFPPSVTQNGEPCETFASLDEYPEEFYNKDSQVSDGTSIDCCYAVALKDAVSPIRLTIHDNYETFSDVGTTEIPLQ